MVICTYKECSRQGRYRYAKEGEDELRCRVHRETRKIDTLRQDCLAEGCKAKGRYRYAMKDFDGLYCNKHRSYKTSNRRNIDEGRELCEICFDVRANYGLPEDPLPSRCQKCAEVNMVSKRKYGLCIVKGCDVRATYGLKEKAPTLCCKHSREAMKKDPTKKYIDVMNSICCGKTKAGKECTKNAIYNFPWETKGKFCKIHAAKGMENVKDRKCGFGGCKTIPCFGYPGKSPQRCTLHCQEGMVDVRNRLCQSPGCTKHPNFNFPSEKCGLFCQEHAEIGMINVQAPRCQHPGCKTTANYSTSSKSFDKMCSKHAKSNMKDIKNKKCTHEKCKKHATFGFLGEQPSTCKKHIQEGMLSNPRKRCIEKDCSNFASFGLSYGKQIYCFDHCPKSDKEQNSYICLTNRKCVNAGINDLCLHLDVLYNGKCRECDPESHFKFYRKAKEEEVKLWLDHSEEHQDYKAYDRSFPEIKECFDRRYRPDFLYDCGTHFVILEVDENQHRAYECERKRMWEIAQSLGLPTIFVRYNPDKYKSRYRDYHKTYNPLPSARKKMLFEALTRAKTFEITKDTKYLQTLKIYFDGFNKSLNFEEVELKL